MIYRRYDENWLAQVKLTKNVIHTTAELITKIEDREDRNLISQAFRNARERFRERLEDGKDTSTPEGEIAQLYLLARKLVHPEDYEDDD